MVARVRRDQRIWLAVGLDLFDHGQQHRLLRARADHVRGHDDLVGTVHRRLRRITLDDAFAGSHLGAVGIGQVGLDLLALAVAALGVGGDEGARGLGFAPQLVDASLALRIQAHGAAFVLALVQRNDLGCGLVQPVGAVRQLRVGAAALFAGVGRQLDAVDGDIVRPIRPRRSQVMSTWLNRRWMWGPSSRTNLAMWV